MTIAHLKRKSILFVLRLNFVTLIYEQTREH
jgi:hypothetical protein